MKAVTFSICIFLVVFVSGQISAQCKIAVYLLKKDSNRVWSKNFTVTKENLEADAFISDQEILMYSLTKLKTKYKGIKRARRIHTIKTSVRLTDKIDNINLQTTGSRKFALVIDDKIIYWGYLSSTLSSIVPDSRVDARISDYEFDLSYYSSTPDPNHDPREDKLLFNCLKKSGRLHHPLYK